MEGTPAGIEVQAVVDTILSVSGIYDVHDLHVWTITTGRNALSCHVVVDGGTTVAQMQAKLRDVEHRLGHLGIGHVTLQPEDAAHPHVDSVLCNP